jgi:hypothetical protein
MVHDKAPEMPDLAELAHLPQQHPWIDIKYQFSNWIFDLTHEYSTLNFLSAGILLTIEL